MEVFKSAVIMVKLSWKAAFLDICLLHALVTQL